MPIPLVEPSEAEAARRVRRWVMGVGQVEACTVSIGYTRKKPKVRLHVQLKEDHDYDEVHRICWTIDGRARQIAPNARVVILSESGRGGSGWETLRLVEKVAAEEPGSRGTQSIHLAGPGAKTGVDLVLEVSQATTPEQNRELSRRLEARIRAAGPQVSEVFLHTGSVSQLLACERAGHGAEILWHIDHVARRFPGLRLLRRPVVRAIGDELQVRLRVASAPGFERETAGSVASTFASEVRDGYRGITTVDVVDETATGPKEA